MKEGWEKKKLGEVCKISSGKCIEAKELSDTYSEGLFPCYGGNGIRGYIAKKSHSGLYPIIGRVGALCGNVHLVDGDFYATEHALVVDITTQNISAYWLKYKLTSMNLRSFAKGVAQPVISSGELSKQEIPIPPLSVQESIVSELDILSGIISKHKALQEEYDRLEQSIFYDMFGDPVTNEKGWEVKKLGKVAEKCFAGGDKPSDYREFETEEYRYPIIGNGEGERGILGYSKDFKVDKDSVTIGARGASIGNCRICTFKFTPVIRLITIIPSEKINVVYLFTIAKMLEFNISGAGQAQLTVPNVINKLIPLPPLSLQQSFADKISAIEQMKAKNKAAQEETEMLFNERMAYYF